MRFLRFKLRGKSSILNWKLSLRILLLLTSRPLKRLNPKITQKSLLTRVLSWIPKIKKRQRVFQYLRFSIRMLPLTCATAFWVSFLRFYDCFFFFPFFFLYHRKSISDTRNSFRLLARMCFVNRKREREKEKKKYMKRQFIFLRENFSSKGIKGKEKKRKIGNLMNMPRSNVHNAKYL